MAPPSRPPTTPATLGTAIHRAIARSLAPQEPQARRRIGDDLVDLADRIAIETGVAAYLGTFHPGPGWRLLGCEVRLATSIADLVFESAALDLAGATRILIDELKTTVDRRSIAGPRTLAQLERLLTDGRARWGARLLGVRLVAPGCRVARLIRSRADLERLRADLA